MRDHPARRRMRYSPYLWTSLAVAVALLALTSRAVALVLMLTAVTAERAAAVVVVALGVADEYVSARAGLPPLAGLIGGAR